MARTKVLYHNVEEQLINIPGTKLYRKLAKAGTTMSGLQRHIDYIASKTNDIIYTHDPKADGKVFEYVVNIYMKEDDNMSMEDFRQAILDGNIHPINPMPLCTDDKQNYTLDDNGNLLLKKHGYHIDDDKRWCGNLIVHKDGTIVRDIDGLNLTLHHNAFGFYPVEVYKNEFNSKSRRYETVGLEYNFIDPNGSAISLNSFARTQEPQVTPISHKFALRKDGKIFIDKNHNINPIGYVYSDHNQVTFYPSPTSLLIANRVGLDNNQPGFLADETPYLRDHYKRMAELPKVKASLTKLFKTGKLDYISYKKTMCQLDEEDSLINNFIKELETPADRKIQDEVLYPDDVM